MGKKPERMTDRLSLVIAKASACASIAANTETAPVHRDRLMTDLFAALIEATSIVASIRSAADQL